MRSKKQGKPAAVTKANSTGSVPHGDNKYHQVSDKKTLKFEEIALQIGKLTAEKNLAYGNSAQRSEQILRVLFPDGVRPSQFQNMLLITRVLDKLSRLATDNDPFGENQWKDICGYSLIGAANGDKQ